MRNATLVGIDVSTTGVKALLVNGHGRVIASATTPLTLSTPHPLWCEQQPEDWWTATIVSLKQLLAHPGVDASRVAAIGLTGQMHGLVLIDDSGSVVRPAILWNDQRTGDECDAIRQRIGRERLIAIAGNDALTGFTAPKLLWVARHEPEAYRRARTMLLPKDYVRFRLTRTRAMDKADGSGTLLFDLAARNWSAEIAGALDVPLDWLPPTFEGPEITATISPDAAAATGLRAGTPVVAGGGDQSAGAVGVGAVTPGIVSIVLGTSGVVFATTESATIERDGRLHAFCHAVSGRWHVMGVMLSAAGSLQWYRDVFAQSLDFDALLAEASTVEPCADGLLFLPYLTGERTPHPDPLARGAFVGLTRRHERRHLTRAVLEGVAFGLRDCYELVTGAVGTVGAPGAEGAPGARRAPGAEQGPAVRVSGGGAKGELWRQILASVLSTTLERVSTTEGAALGAALLAGVGAGVWPDVPSACEATIPVTGRDNPDADWQQRYAEGYERYRELYPALRDTFGRRKEQTTVSSSLPPRGTC